MILKYYTNGWNLVDVGEDVQIFNIRMDEINKEIKTERGCSLKDYKEKCYVKLSNKVFDLGIGTSIQKEHVLSKITLTDDFYSHCNNSRDEMVYVRVVLYYNKFGDYVYTMYNGSSYLLNDKGVTLETLSRDRQIN